MQRFVVGRGILLFSKSNIEETPAVRDQYLTVRDQYLTVRNQYLTVRNQYLTVRDQHWLYDN